LLLAVLPVGCGSLRGSSSPGPAGNPLFVAAANHEAVWERTVDVVHDYQFEIARESRLDGVIETEYKVGSGLAEPWHADSVGFYERLESSIQPIRRRVFVRITPVEGGFLLGVEAYKEIEHVEYGVASTSPGGATFQHSRPLQRDLNLVVGQSRPSGWVPLGRDLKLERAMANCLRSTFAAP
jgi:hypothetical protein